MSPNAQIIKSPCDISVSEINLKNALAFCPDGFSVHVLKTPINVTLRRFAHGSDAVSASWNTSLAGGHGGWQSDGCRILGHHDNFTTISCNSLGNYGLLMVGVAYRPTAVF